MNSASKFKLIFAIDDNNTVLNKLHICYKYIENYEYYLSATIDGIYYPYIPIYDLTIKFVNSNNVVIIDCDNLIITKEILKEKSEHTLDANISFVPKNEIFNSFNLNLKTLHAYCTLEQL